MGGLGNIFFQMILYYKLLAENQSTPTVFKNLTEKNKITSLINFQVHKNYYKYFFPEIKFKDASFFQYFIAVILFKLSKTFNIQIFEFHFVKPKQEELISTKKNMNYLGYFQSRSFLSSNKFYFDLVLKNIRSKIQDFNNKNVFHFRANDSIYKEKNIDILKKLIALHQDDLVIVTDDKVKFKSIINNFNENNLISSDILTDFSILCSAKCKLYCSISTFSWWSSHLVQKNCEVYLDKEMLKIHGYHGLATIKTYDTLFK